MEVSTSGCKIQTQLIKKVGFQGEVLYRKYSHLKDIGKFNLSICPKVFIVRKMS